MRWFLSYFEIPVIQKLESAFYQYSLCPIPTPSSYWTLKRGDIHWERYPSQLLLPIENYTTKQKIKAKEAKIELDKLEAARKKRDAEIAKQRLNSPETGFLREQNQENKATVPVLIGLVSFIVSPVVVLFAKRRNRKMRKF